MAKQPLKSYKDMHDSALLTFSDLSLLQWDRLQSWKHKFC
jgi:hypothetical protein